MVHGKTLYPPPGLLLILKIGIFKGLLHDGLFRENAPIVDGKEKNSELIRPAKFPDNNPACHLLKTLGSVDIWFSGHGKRNWLQCVSRDGAFFSTLGIIVWDHELSDEMSTEPNNINRCFSGKNPVNFDNILFLNWTFLFEQSISFSPVRVLLSIVLFCCFFAEWQTLSGIRGKKRFICEIFVWNFKQQQYLFLKGASFSMNSIQHHFQGTAE